MENLNINVNEIIENLNVKEIIENHIKNYNSYNVVKVSPYTVNEIRKELKERLKGYEFEYVEMNEYMYEIYVDSNIRNHLEDINEKTKNFKVIRIIYPYDYYACDKYITTNDLQKCYKKALGCLNDYYNEIIKLIEI